MVYLIKRIVKKSLSKFSNNIVHFIPKTKEKLLSAEEAKNLLEKYSPDPNTSALWNRPETEYNHDLTIIIPVYNVEKYLQRCLESVLYQKTNYLYEVIVVNDCSSDNSMNIIKKYEGHPLLKIINHLSNQGVSVARNNGLREAKGEYVTFVDSDDFLEENAVDNLMTLAYRYDADIVQGGYYHITCDSERLLKRTKYRESASVPPNGMIAGMICGKVYKLRLFNCVCFPENTWFEDTIVTALISHLSSKIVTTDVMVYYYRQNPAGATYVGKAQPKAIDTYYVHRCVMEARKDLGLVCDVKFYEHLLRMVVLSYERTILMPDEIQLALFVLFRELLLNVRQEHFKINKRYKNLDSAIIDGDYQRYSFLCKYC